MSERELESEKERLEQKLERKESELKDFQDDPQAQIDERVSDLSDGIAQTSPREPTHPDNRSMHEHLVKLKRGIENDREAFVRWRISNIEREISEIEADLEELE